MFSKGKIALKATYRKLSESVDSTVLANVKENAVMPDSWYSQYHLANALGSLIRAKDETCFNPPLDMPHLASLSPASRNRHSKHARCAAQSFCRASLPPCKIKKQLV